MAVAAPAARALLQTVARKQVWQNQLAARLSVLWKTLLALLAFGLMDLVWPCPTLLRGLFLLTLVVGAGFGLIAPRRPPPQKTLPQLARAIERQRPELDNALIHAVQFEAASLPARSLSAALAEREVARAEAAARQLRPETLLDRTRLRRESARLLGVGLLCLALALLAPRGLRFQLPRLLLFWQERPPFTLTDLAVQPGDARIRAGGGLTITVRVSGKMPRRLELVTEADGQTARALPMEEAGTGLYTARLQKLTRDTGYTIVADTGRSRRYTIRVLPSNVSSSQASAASKAREGEAVGRAKPSPAMGREQKAGEPKSPQQSSVKSRASSDAASGVSAARPDRKALPRPKSAPLRAETDSQSNEPIGSPANRPLSPAATYETDSYPSEYRRLVQDYFRSLAERR